MKLETSDTRILQLFDKYGHDSKFGSGSGCSVLTRLRAEIRLKTRFELGDVVDCITAVLADGPVDAEAQARLHVILQVITGRPISGVNRVMGLLTSSRLTPQQASCS